jgi:hypothetical protein
MYYNVLVVFFRDTVRERARDSIFNRGISFCEIKKAAAGMIQLMFITFLTLYFYASENIFSGTLRLFLFNWIIFI